MKKIFYSALLLCGVVVSSCTQDYGTLEETFPTDMAPNQKVAMTVEADKFSASFDAVILGLEKSVIEVGVELSTTKSFDCGTNTYYPNDTIVSEFAIDVDKLEPSTTYYARAYCAKTGGAAYSEAVSFATPDHPLGAVMGDLVMSTYDLNVGDAMEYKVSIAADPEDQSVGYMTGLGSTAGVELALGKIKMVFDFEAKTVTIPQGQIIEEGQYGNYLWCSLDPNYEFFVTDQDIVGTYVDGVIEFASLSALIVEGGNEGVAHTVLADIVIKK